MTQVCHCVAGKVGCELVGMQLMRGAHDAAEPQRAIRAPTDEVSS